jgi:hypothetical protein
MNMVKCYIHSESGTLYGDIALRDYASYPRLNVPSSVRACSALKHAIVTRNPNMISGALHLLRATN